MSHIGLLYIGKQDGDNQSSRILEESGIFSVSIVEKKQLNQLEGVVVILSEPIDSLTMVEWVLAIRENKAIFIWIVCSYCTKYLRNLCCHLRNNIIIETGFQDIEELPIIIKNSLNYRHRVSHADNHEKNEFDSFIKPNEMSLITENSDIRLTNLELKTLNLLKLNLNRVTLYQELCEAIYPDSDLSKAKYRLANLIFSLRKKLKIQNIFAIDVIRTKGYVLKKY